VKDETPLKVSGQDKMRLQKMFFVQNYFSRVPFFIRKTNLFYGSVSPEKSFFVGVVC